MRKATAAKGSAAPSPIPGSDSAGGGEAMRRTGSGGGRAPSALSLRKDSPLQRNEASVLGTPAKLGLGRPQVSRNSSANTAVPASRLQGASSPRPDKLPTQPRTRLSSLPITANADSTPSSPNPAESSSDESSSSVEQSRIIRRPPRPKQHAEPTRSIYSDDDEAEPAFLPMRDTGSGHKDLGATLRGDPRRAPAKDSSQTSDSSTSSAAFLQKPGPLSPRRAAELAGKGKGYSREGSDMGSSFSDLDGMIYCCINKLPAPTD
jgi:hypothetical protein